MMRSILVTAIGTGVFCAAFSVGIDWLTDMLERNHVIALSFVSGTLGSLVSQSIFRRKA